MEPLTPNQLRVVGFVRDFIRENGYSPTLDEIARYMRVSKPTVQQYLRALESKGVIRRRRYAHRSIEIVRQGVDGARLPLAGRIAAGSPIEAIEDGETVDIAEAMGVRQDRDHFILQVKGDSMIEDGIFDGDYVVVEKRETARNGETVVALLPDNTATLKRFYHEKGRIRLQPANPNMEPIRVRDVVVQGIVKGVFRPV